MFRLGCAAAAGALLSYVALREIHRTDLRDRLALFPINFLSTAELYQAARVPKRRPDALAELTRRLGYQPTL